MERNDKKIWSSLARAETIIREDAHLCTIESVQHFQSCYRGLPAALQDNL